MAVKRFGLSVSLGALVLAGLTLPTLATAQERGQGWRNGGNEARPERSENRGGGSVERAARPENRGNGGDSNRGGGGWQRQPPQQSAPQAQQSSQPGGWQGRGNWAGHAAQTQASPVPAPAPRGQWARQGDRPDGNARMERRGERPEFVGRTPGTPSPAVAPAPQPRQASSGWSGGDRRGPSGGTDSSRRDGNREGWQGSDRWRGERRDDDRRDGTRWADNRHRDGNYRGEGWRNPNGNRDRYHGDYRRWSHDWRRDNRYNWSWYRNHNRHIYHMPSYYSPYRNYRYSRISIGFYLDSLFFSSRYWIDDPWRYRLPDAYGPYRWVRYYDDALLVDIYSGEVVDVIHNFFW